MMNDNWMPAVTVTEVVVAAHYKGGSKPMANILIGDLANRLTAKHADDLGGRRITIPQIRYLLQKGKIREPARIGLFRVFEETDIPDIEAALVKIGALPAPVGGVAHAS